MRFGAWMFDIFVLLGCIPCLMPLESCLDDSRLLFQRAPRFVARSSECACNRAAALALLLRSFLIATSSFFLPGGMMRGSVKPLV